MQVTRLPDEYFNKFQDKPVLLKPFDPESKKQALMYLEGLNRLLVPVRVEAKLYGSTELEIFGKGEWEFGIFLEDDTKWAELLDILGNQYPTVQSESEDRILFEDLRGDQEIEIMAMKGSSAQQNQAIMAYWKKHADKLHEYEQLKQKYAFSKREYYRWKYNYIADILEKI